MTATDRVQALIVAAQDLANRALSDDSLAERLLANTHDTIAEAGGLTVPAGIMMKARRLDDGTVEISGQADPDFEGELDETALDNVAGGRDIDRYWVVVPAQEYRLVRDGARMKR